MIFKIKKKIHFINQTNKLLNHFIFLSIQQPIDSIQTMPNKPQYINLPIYSIATYNQYFYLSGGGGGKTGIKNQIFIYKYKITNGDPVARIETGDKIIQNMYICPQRKILIASANQNIKIFDVLNNGVELKQKIMFKGDYATKNSTIYSLCFHTKINVLCTAGEDMIVRFFHLDEQQQLSQKYFQHNQHANPLKNVDHNQKNLFLSCDTNQIVITDIQTKKVVRKIFNDQLQPQKSMFLSAYFQNSGDSQLIISHYILRKAAYVTRETGGKFQTSQITKDQSCLTAYNRGLNLLGVACGNGSTYLIRGSNLSIVGKQHNHGFVITGGTISRGGRFVTGTPQCSYNVQQSDQPIFGCSMIPLVALIVTLLMIFLLGSITTLSDISQSDL